MLTNVILCLCMAGISETSNHVVASLLCIKYTVRTVSNKYN